MDRDGANNDSAHVAHTHIHPMALRKPPFSISVARAHMYAKDQGQSLGAALDSMTTLGFKPHLQAKFLFYVKFPY